ncbi:MAG: flavodoxin family protein [Spirochaetales bacterium]|nr:flavodoxin family protein [Spirochaetales bacterium]
MANKILILNGSPRRNGNTSMMIAAFAEGAEQAGSKPEIIRAEEVNIKSCRGCLRCNLFQRCVIKGDDWGELSKKILDCDTLVFATPVYFHHMTAPLKMIVDRFRSFIHVQITEEGLIHTPWQTWKRRIILLTCMGSSSAEDAKPLEELFESLIDIMGGECEFTSLTATRLAVGGQIGMPEQDLAELYLKLKIPITLAGPDSLHNRAILTRLKDMGCSTGG